MPKHSLVTAITVKVLVPHDALPSTSEEWYASDWPEACKNFPKEVKERIEEVAQTLLHKNARVVME